KTDPELEAGKLLSDLLDPCVDQLHGHAFVNFAVQLIEFALIRNHSWQRRACAQDQVRSALGGGNRQMISPAGQGNQSLALDHLFFFGPGTILWHYYRPHGPATDPSKWDVLRELSNYPYGRH